jgi:Ca-activated chloride channel family protein
MKQQDIETFLKGLKAPAPDPEARLRAKRAALAAFERASPDNLVELPSQESVRETRLSREHHSRGSTSMKRYMNRSWYAVAAGLGVLALGLTWVLPNLDTYTRDLAHTESPTKLPEALAGHASAPEESGTTAGSGPTAEPNVPAEMDAAEAPRQSGPALQAETHAAPAAVSGPAQPPAADADVSARREAAKQDAARAEDLAKAKANEREQRARAGSLAMQITPPPAPPPAPARGNEVVVTGMRRPLLQAQETKREAVGFIGTEAGYYQDEGRDQFEHFDSNPVRRVAEHPVSTFSADVDTASYSFVRAELSDGALPQKDAVRVEEMINYFDYAWPAASSRRAPFEPTVVVSDSPWNEGRKLVHIGIKGYEVDRDEAPDANLVLLLDVSGSMNSPDKLPLAVRSMELLLDSLKPGDTVGIVVYAGAAGTVLEPTPVRDKEKIIAALRSLRPGGSTAGAAGIERAYQLAEAHFRKGGVNRILLATDGDFNVGIAGTEELKSFVERKREKGVYLSVLGFGQGNYRDELAQALAQNGNGVAAYIDTESEARKVLVKEASASLFTIARDVKLQVEFNPVTVSEYRLVGYETRALEREDFNNDAVDAGDVGAGHTVTVIYEVTPVGVATQSVDEPRYPENREENRREKAAQPRGNRDEYGFLKIRYKLPDEQKSRLISEPIPLRTGSVPAAVKRDVAFSTAVAGFAQLLRGGTYTGALSYADVIEQAQASKGADPFGYRGEFIELVRRAQQLQGR